MYFSFLLCLVLLPRSSVSLSKLRLRFSPFVLARFSARPRRVSLSSFCVRFGCNTSVSIFLVVDAVLGVGGDTGNRNSLERGVSCAGPVARESTTTG